MKNYRMFTIDVDLSREGEKHMKARVNVRGELACGKGQNYVLVDIRKNDLSPEDELAWVHKQVVQAMQLAERP